MRNLPLNVDDRKLKEIFSTVTGRKLRVNKVLIIRSKDRVDSSGHGRSMGYGFVEFKNHKDALAALRATNNNPDIFGADRRPIVEFSLENSVVVNAKERRSEKAQQRQRQNEEEHAHDVQPKTNKERRLERNQKRREKRQRKREVRKKRKLEQTSDGDGEKTAEDNSKGKGLNDTKREGKITSENLWKVKKGRKLPVPAKLDENDRSNRGEFSSFALTMNRSNAKSATINTNSRPKLSKVKKTSKTPRDINENIQQTISSSAHSNASEAAGVLSRKRKGTRRKEQEKKDESNFSEMVNKYKSKLFGKDDSESSAKRSRWFDD